MQNRLNETSLFLLENHPEKFSDLIAALKRAGLNDNHFINKNGDLYIKTDGTLLRTTLTEDRYADGCMSFYDLYCGKQRICGTKRKISASESYTISYINALFKLPPSLLISTAPTLFTLKNNGSPSQHTVVAGEKVGCQNDHKIKSV